jgi:hypothetical protein
MVVDVEELPQRGGSSGGGGGGRNWSGGGGSSGGETLRLIGELMNVSVVVVPAVIVAVPVLPESVPPVTLASVKPSGTASVTTTVPTGTETPAPQTGPSDPAGKVMLGMVTAGEAVKVTVDPSSA